MDAKRKVIRMGVGMLGMAFLMLVVKFIMDMPYRKHLPEQPDFKSLSIPLREQISQAVKKAWLNPSSGNIGQLGMVYHSCGDYSRAVECYTLAVKKNKSGWIWRYYLGYLNAEMGDAENAIRNFSYVTRHNPQVYHAWFYLGDSYMKQGNNNKAEQTFNRILTAAKQDAHVRTKRVNFFPLVEYTKFQLTRIYLNTNRTDQAEEMLLELVNTNRTYSPVYRLLGNVYTMKGDSMTGRRFTIRAKDLADATPLLDTLVDKIALVSRSEMYLPKQIDDAVRSGNPEWAEALLKNAFIYIPDDKYMISKAITFYLRMNMGTKCLPYLGRHMSFFKDDYKEIKGIADLLYAKGFFAQSMNYLKRAAELMPEESEIKAGIAMCQMKTGSMESAKGSIAELIRNNRSNVKILAIAADLLLQAGEKEKARSVLLELEQVEPSNPFIPKIKGRMAEKEGNAGLAVSMYKAAYKADPQDLVNIQSLGNMLLDREMWLESITFFRGALVFHPNEPYLLEKLGALLVSCPDPKLRNANEGMEYCERAFYNISSSSHTILAAGRNLAQAYALMQNYEAAVFYLQICINMAQNEKMPADYIQELLKQAETIQLLRSGRSGSMAK